MSCCFNCFNSSIEYKLFKRIFRAKQIDEIEYRKYKKDKLNYKKDFLNEDGEIVLYCNKIFDKEKLRTLIKKYFISQLQDTNVSIITEDDHITITIRDIHCHPY